MSGCSTNQIPTEIPSETPPATPLKTPPPTPIETPPVTPIETPPATPPEEPSEIAQRPCQLVLDADLLANAAEGKLKGVGPVLGDKLEKWEKAYGAPDSTGTFSGDYVMYDDCVLYTSDGETVSVMDIRVDQSAAQVKETIGEPSEEGISEIGDGEEYSLFYEAGDYGLYFDYENEKAEKGYLRYKLN